MDTSYNYQIYLVIIPIFLGVTDIFSLTVSMNQNPVGNLESEADIVCSYIEQPGDIVLTITLEKNEGGNFVQFATFFAPNLNQNATFAGTTAATELSSRAELTNPTTNNNLAASMKIKDIQCGDEAIYKCQVSHVTGGQTVTAEATTNLTVNVKPDRMNDMEISPLPSAAGQYPQGKIITLSCTGTVGAYPDPPRIIWCIQRSGDFSPIDLDTDYNFRSMWQTNAQSLGSGPKTTCQFERTSTVVYQVANTDTDTIFFCQITAPGDNGTCGQGTVRQQKSIEVAQTTQLPESENTGGGAQTSPDLGSGFGGTVNPNIWLLIGAIIGGVANFRL